MEDTVVDFWRMVTEHNITTMVMLSGDNAWKSWEPEPESKFGNVTVKLLSKVEWPDLVSFVTRFYTNSTRPGNGIH